MRHVLRLRRLLALGGLFLLAAGGTASAQTDVAGLSIEDLLNTEITSVSRKEQTLSRTAAAVHVITAEDIRRSGATTLADVLRMAPGFTVAQIDATTWAISARGFNGFVANKLLVLIDGRSVYSPMFSGVHWEMQNLALSDIERIELVRGPGGTLWGANAVNGVINIITKRADETQGGQITAAAGTMQRGLTEVRYGGKAGDRGYYRLSGRYSNRATGKTIDGFSEPDDASVTQLGGRFDWRGEIDTVFVNGSVQDGTGMHRVPHLSLTPPFSTEKFEAGPYTDRNILFSWNRSASSQSDRGIQAYYQNYTRGQGALFERWWIADVETRQRQTVGRHELVIGGGFRATQSHNDNSPTVAFANRDDHKNLVTAFAQDEIELSHNIRVTPGAKFEHNDRTGFEWQPSIRGTWTPSRGQSVWAAASRAVRTPSKIDRDLFAPSAVLPIPGPLPTILTVEGSADYRSEDVEAVEAGYRWQRGIGSIDIAAFINGYDDLKQMIPGRPYLGTFEQQPVLFMPLRATNAVDATSRGVEIAGALRPISRLRIAGSYSWFNLDMGLSAATAEVPTAEGPVPAHQFQLRSYVDLPARTEIGAMLYAASDIEELELKSYRRLDLRFAWRVLPRVELSATGQNLFHDGAIEYDDVGPQPMPIRTAVIAGVTWGF